MTASTLEGVGVRRRVRARTESSATYVACALVVLFVIPDRYAIGPQGLSLTPSLILGLGALLVWASHALLSRTSLLRLNPLRVVLLGTLVLLAVSVAAAYRRPLISLEANAVLRSTVITLGVAGTALLLCDGVRRSEDLKRILVALASGGYVSALVAIAQRLFNFGYIDYWAQVPGLHVGNTATLPAAVLLSGRAVGTGLHPIEFSVASACLVPVAVVCARFADSRNAAVLHRLGAGVLIVGSLIGISRSGFFGIVLVAVLIIPRLPFRQRVNALAVGAVTFALVQFGIHGTLSTLRYQLLHIGSDASSQGRTQDYSPIFALFQQHRLEGIGGGTFLPQQYFFLDNSWLGQLVMTGLIGTVGLGALLLATLYLGGVVKRRAEDPFLVEAAHAAVVMLFVLIVCAGFFDEFSFLQTYTLLYVSIGIIGAVWAISTLRGDSPAQEPIGV